MNINDHLSYEKLLMLTKLIFLVFGWDKLLLLVKNVELFLKKSSDLWDNPNIKSSDGINDLCKFKIASSDQTKYK